MKTLSDGSQRTILSDTGLLNELMRSIMHWARQKHMAFSQLVQAPGKPSLPPELSCEVPLDSWDALDIFDDAAKLIASSMELTIPFLFRKMNLDQRIEGSVEAAHRSLIDPVFTLALHLAESFIVKSEGETRLVVSSGSTIESVSECEGGRAALRGPLDYALDSVMTAQVSSSYASIAPRPAVSTEYRTLFVIEAKQRKTYHRGKDQLRLQMICLRERENDYAHRNAISRVDPICGVTSDGIFYQFHVLGATMFFESPLLGVSELRHFTTFSQFQGVTWLPAVEIAKHMAALMIGQIPLEMRCGWSQQFLAAISESLAPDLPTDWNSPQFKEPIRNMMPLHIAAREHGAKLVQYLLNRNHPLMSRDIFGYTPLRWAAARENVPAFERLLAAQKSTSDDDFFHRSNSGTSIFRVLKGQCFHLFRRHFAIRCAGVSFEDLRPETEEWMRGRNFERFRLWPDNSVRADFGVSWTENRIYNLATALKKGLEVVAEDYIHLDQESAMLIKLRPMGQMLLDMMSRKLLADGKWNTLYTLREHFWEFSRWSLCGTLCENKKWGDLCQLSSLCSVSFLEGKVAQGSTLFIRPTEDKVVGALLCLSLHRDLTSEKRERYYLELENFSQEYQAALEARKTFLNEKN